MLPLPAPLSVLPPPSRLVVRLLNALLAREPWARERLQRHAGKTVRFALGGFALSLTIASDGQVDVADAAVVADVTLSGVPERMSLARLLPGSAKPDFAELTHISGDAALAQVVADLARDLRWDVEDELAQRIGDVPAARLLGGTRAVTGFARNAALRLAQNISEYLAEERGVVAGRPALAQWRLDMDQLGQDTDALARRLSALDARVARQGSARGAR
ncbi:MAG: SCP2 sterol-binding domain-containing protein [Bordetella sp.]|nr:SCP2 sterol-binding domain-containing protein [Bordetella sp.]